MSYDVIIRNGLWFDGTGRPPLTRSLGIRDGIVARGVRRAAGRDRLPRGHRRDR